MSDLNLDAERALFEAELRKEYGEEHFVKRMTAFDGLCYDSTAMNGAWRGWQAARRAVPAQASAPDGVSPTYAELEAMYHDQCELTDKWADKAAAHGDAALQARIAELERDLATMNQRYAAASNSLLRPAISAANPLPPGCFCPPDKCQAPKIMGRQTPCRREFAAPAPLQGEQSAPGDIDTPRFRELALAWARAVERGGDDDAAWDSMVAHLAAPAPGGEPSAFAVAVANNDMGVHVVISQKVNDVIHVLYSGKHPAGDSMGVFAAAHAPAPQENAK